MLAPDDRTVLSDALRPPLGYKLDTAVATTLTLDLGAALVAPLSFASHEAGNSGDPIAVTEAVRSCASRVDLFCQAGQIIVPHQPSDLMAFLEQMVHEVRRPTPGHLFHPKVWALRYVSPDDFVYRFVCSTRNLTNDRSWDALLRLDGTATRRNQARNRPLAEFVRALPGMSITDLEPTRHQRILELADDLQKVEWELPADATDVTFHALGLPGVKKTWDFSGYRHLAVAPFVNAAGIDTVISEGSRGATIVSSVEDFERLDPTDLVGIDTHIISPLAGLNLDEGDDAQNNEVSQEVLGGLHAKLYVVERDRRAHLFVGSANITDAAWNGNVEFMVEIVGSTSKFGVEQFVGAESAFRTLLEQYEPSGNPLEEDPTADELRKLENLIRALPELGFNASVKPYGDNYTLHVSTEKPLPDIGSVTLTAELLTRRGRAANLTESVVDFDFAGVGLADITPFIVLRAVVKLPGSETEVSRSTVVRARLTNDPAGRLDEVLARQFDTPEKFLHFLMLLLGMDGLDITVFDPNLSGAGTASWWMGNGNSGVFEMMVRALADRPESLDDLGQLVNRLRSTAKGRDVIPSGFDELWDVVVAARTELSSGVSR